MFQLHISRMKWSHFELNKDCFDGTLFFSSCSGPFAVNCRICVRYRLRFGVLCHRIHQHHFKIALSFQLCSCSHFHFCRWFLWWFGCRSHLLVIDMLQTAHDTQSNIPISYYRLLLRSYTVFSSSLAQLHIRARETKNAKTILMDQFTHIHTNSSSVFYGWNENKQHVSKHFVRSWVNITFLRSYVSVISFAESI